MRSRRSALLALGALVALAAAPPAARAGAYLSRPEALELAFPDAERVEETSHLLSDAQAHAVESLAGAPLESRLVTLYTGHADGRITGYALIEMHIVRTQPEAFLVVLSPDGRVRDLRMLAFYEPEEYLPPERWLQQFENEPLSPELRLHRKIHGITGSTLSSQAVTGGVRRALALYEVLVNDARVPPRTAAHGGMGPAGR